MTMPSYLSPGVFVEEVPSAIQTIAGVGTNTVGFIGVVDDTIQYPVLLPDDKYQGLLRDAQNKIYGADDDYKDAAIQGRLATAQGALNDANNRVARATTAAGKTDNDVATATNAQGKLKPDASDADKAAAQAAIDTATAAQARARKDVADANAAAKTAGADVARLADLLRTPMNERIRAAKSSSREAARGAVKRYEPQAFAVGDKAPVGQAKLCTNFAEFQARFGPWSLYDDDAVAAGDPTAVALSGHQVLSHAVYAFFNNGGSRCFVARVRQDNLDDDLDKVLTSFESIESISLVAFPGNSADEDVSDKLVAHCEATKYRFAILDAPGKVEDAQGFVDFEQLTYDSADPVLPKRSKHAAVYFPYLLVTDPTLQMQQANNDDIPSKYKGQVHVPCSGHLAGIYARTDTQRGVWKAPANTSVLGAQNVKYYVSRQAQDGLNPQGVNCIRSLNGDITVWGARTVGGQENNEWRYVNVRRTFLYIAKSIDEGTQWVVFEPNDMSLWGKVRRNVSAFLTGVWREGGLCGASPEEAFFVKCDAENNPPDSRADGRLVIEVGLAITQPAEFVIFRIMQGTALQPA
jgi:phage tail sheath protein FI